MAYVSPDTTQANGGNNRRLFLSLMVRQPNIMPRPSALTGITRYTVKFVADIAIKITLSYNKQTRDVKVMPCCCKVKISTLVISRVTGRKLIKFLHDVVGSPTALNR